MKKALKILAVCFTVLLISCSKSSGDEETDLDVTGNWFGTFSGDDMGTFSAFISADGSVSGDLVSNNLQNTYSLNGQIDGAGNLTAVIGTGGNGRSFTGKFNATSGSGTWQDSSLQQSGTWLTTSKQ